MLFAFVCLSHPWRYLRVPWFWVILAHSVISYDGKLDWHSLSLKRPIIMRFGDSPIFGNGWEAPVLFGFKCNHGCCGFKLHVAWRQTRAWTFSWFWWQLAHRQQGFFFSPPIESLSQEWNFEISPRKMQPSILSTSVLIRASDRLSVNTCARKTFRANFESESNLTSMFSHPDLLNALQMILRPIPHIHSYFFRVTSRPS